MIHTRTAKRLHSFLVLALEVSRYKDRRPNVHNGKATTNRHTKWYRHLEQMRIVQPSFFDALFGDAGISPSKVAKS